MHADQSGRVIVILSSEWWAVIQQGSMIGRWQSSFGTIFIERRCKKRRKDYWDGMEKLIRPILFHTITPLAFLYFGWKPLCPVLSHHAFLPERISCIPPSHLPVVVLFLAMHLSLTLLALHTSSARTTSYSLSSCSFMASEPGRDTPNLK